MGLASIRFPDLAGPYQARVWVGEGAIAGLAPGCRFLISSHLASLFLHLLRAQLQDAGVGETEASKTVPCCGDACAVPAEAS